MLKFFSGKTKHHSIVRDEFSADWYTKTYSKEFERNRRPGETPVSYFLREGALLGHDPNPYFSEMYFRLNNKFVRKEMRSNSSAFGFLIYVARREAKLESNLCNYQVAAILRRLRVSLDIEYIASENIELKGNRLAAADFYFTQSMEKRSINPTASFSEEYYINRHADVREVRNNGGLISGFQHFINSGRRERRQSTSVAEYIDAQNATGPMNSDDYLNSNIPGISTPSEIGLSDALAALTRPLDIEVDEAGSRRIHVFLMHYFPEIFFGGFAAFFDFIRELKRLQGVEIKLYVSNDISPDVHAENVRRVAKQAPDVAAIFDEIELLPKTAKRIVVSPDCDILSYSMETHFLASQVSAALGKIPYFFIQDDEAMFHPNDSIASSIYSAFEQKHYGIINSQSLMEYFQSAENYPTMSPEVGYECTSFENKILPLKLDRQGFEDLHANKTKRKLVFYGRPERHAARNQYAFVVTALRQAVAAGIFGKDWEFWAMGSLDHTGELQLGNGHVLKQITRVSKEEYESFIASSDIGISMISTPHPGIIHFQMAAFGIVTLTNTGFMRTPDVLTNISANIIPVRLTFSSMLEGLRDAVERAEHHTTRYDNAIESQIESTNDTLNAAAKNVSSRMTSTRRT